jgi:hypothetical protein
MSLQSLFEKVSSHNAAEDSRGYQTLFAKLIESMLFTSWTPDISVPAIGTPQSQRRAGYLIEFAARKIVNSREKKRVLFELADALRAAVDKAPHTTLYPNPAQNQYSMERNTDQLAREWGLLDGATRSNILKMIKAVVPV